MRALARVLGGIGVLLTCIVVSSTEVAGDVDSADAAGDGSASDELHEPGTPYDLGPGAIRFEHQPPDQQANILRMRARMDANQPSESHAAFANAVDQAVVRAQAQIATRILGLEGVGDQGVVE